MARRNSPARSMNNPPNSAAGRSGACYPAPPSTCSAARSSRGGGRSVSRTDNARKRADRRADLSHCRRRTAGETSSGAATKNNLEPLATGMFRHVISPSELVRFSGGRWRHFPTSLARACIGKVGNYPHLPPLSPPSSVACFRLQNRARSHARPSLPCSQSPCPSCACGRPGPSSACRRSTRCKPPAGPTNWPSPRGEPDSTRR